MVPLIVNGVTYQYPELDDEGWGNSATNWAVAITQGTLQKNGGLFSLISDVDFGPSFGIKSIYFKSRSSNIASTGVLRLSNTDTITFRNAGNTADLAFTAGSSDAIPSYNGIDLVNLSTAQTLTNKTFSGSTFTGNTFNSPIINTPTVTGGTFSSSTLSSPTITGGTLSSSTLSSPTVTGGTFSSPTITNGTFSSPTITGTALFPNGSAAAPSVANTTSTTTGLYWTTNTLNFTTNGVNAGSIDSNGLWTIGLAGASQNHIVNGTSLSLKTPNPNPVTFAVVNSNATGAYNATVQMQTASGGGSPLITWNQFTTQFSMGVYSVDSLLRIEAGSSTFGTNTVAAKIDNNGTWIIGPSGGTHTHSINGNLTSTGTNTAGSFIPTSSTIPTNGMYLSSGGFIALASNGNLAASFDHSGTPNLTIQGNITTANGISASTLSSFSSTLVINSNGLTALSFDGTPNATFTHNVGIQSNNSLKLFDSGNTNYVGINAPSSVSSIYTITLPAAAPAANTSLTYNGSNYVWAAEGIPPLNAITLSDNTTNGTVATFVSASTNVVFVQYSLKRGTSYQAGQLTIANDGSTPSIIDANTPIGDCGTTFSVSISGSNLLLRYTTTSTGTSVSMKYSVDSWQA